MMNIFGFVVGQEGRFGLSLLADLLQAANDLSQLFRREHCCVLEGSGVGAARLKLVGQQARIERERTLPAFKCGIEWLPEAARPQHPFGTPSCSAARECEGIPPLPSNPAASTWSLMSP